MFRVVLYALILPCVLSATCDKSAKTCEFWLDIGFKLTMMQGKVALYPEGGKLYRYDVNNTSTATPIDPEKEGEKVVSADGWEEPRLVIVANGTLPGPSIEVYEGQTVIVHVKNSLPSDTTTIHWHGLHQPDTPWMDGVAYVNQCPIGPEQTFTYRFKAKPKGTFWYHSHVGAQRTMGLYGAFIIREKEPEMKEFLAVINDWNHDWDSNMAYYRMFWGIYENRTRVRGTKSLDGAFFSMFRFQAGLINGKGRYFDSDGNHNGAPLEVFTVNTGEYNTSRHMFRLISAGSLYPFRVSVDNHNITVIASDGYDLQPVTAESLIINPGERFDFYITADQPVGNYWIRAMTIELDESHIAEAILRYDGAPMEEPRSQRKVCTESDKCVVINCPFSYYPKLAHTNCVTFDELKSLVDDDPAPTSPDMEERFLNFAFPGTTWTPGSVNGRQFRHPAVSVLTQPEDMGKYKCGDDCGEQKVCKCTYSLDLEHDKVYQIVFMNMGKGRGWSHPIHMHGHSFYVVKMGYAPYNETTGKLLGENLEVDCRGVLNRADSFCNDAAWEISSWKGDNIPGLELKNPPRKDTIIVPTGGYVVVRIKADNPGVWFMHCHIELHNMDGMAMVLNESFAKQPTPPEGFPRCGDFEYPDQMTQVMEVTTMSPSPEPLTVPHDTFWAVTGVLAGVIVLLVLALVFLVCRKEQKSKYAHNITDGHKNQSFEDTK